MISDHFCHEVAILKRLVYVVEDNPGRPILMSAAAASQQSELRAIALGTASSSQLRFIVGVGEKRRTVRVSCSLSPDHYFCIYISLATEVRQHT